MMRKISSFAILAAVSCSANFTPEVCVSDGECGAYVCEQQASGKTACVSPASAPLRIGMSAPISGPEQALGTDMKLGVTMAFQAQNAAGGIHGRQLVLNFRDDEYQPDLAEQDVRALVDVQASAAPPKCPTTNTAAVAGQMPVSTTALYRGPNAVLAFIGNVGTPTMVRTAPISLETGTVFFGAFTGASTILRDQSAGDCAKYIFNVRASYANEARATLEYFLNVKVPDYTHIISFDQNDTFGQAGYSGMIAAYTAVKGGFPANADPTNPIIRFRYTRGDETTVPPLVTSATAYITQILSADTAPHTVGIFMTDTYGPAAEFITGIRQWQFDGLQTSLQKATRLNLYFSNVSFSGPNALADRLKQAGTINGPMGPVPYTQNVLVSQVVPNYQSDSSDVVVDYRKQIAASGQPSSFTSLEGYIAARVFVAGLASHSGPFTPQSLVPTFENLPNLSIGLGAGSGFGAGNHNFSKSVWGTMIDANGDFQNVYFWSDGIPIQFFE